MLNGGATRASVAAGNAIVATAARSGEFGTGTSK